MVYFCSWFKLFTSKKIYVGTPRLEISTKANSFPRYQGILLYLSCHVLLDFLHVIDVFGFHVYDARTHFHCLDWHDCTNVLLVLVLLIVSYIEKSILITLLPSASPKILTVPEIQPHYCCLWQGRKATTILSGFYRPRISFHPLYTNYWSALDKRTLMKKPRTLLSSVKENQYSNLRQPLYDITLQMVVIEL